MERGGILARLARIVKLGHHRRMPLCDTYAPASPDEARLISRYGMRPSRRTGEPQMHAGIDIGAARGVRVYAPRAARVALVGRDAERSRGLSGYGNCVVLHHEDEDRYTFYAHLDQALVEVGQQVYAGEPIGTVGNSTNRKFPGMGVHLHMEVRRPKPDGSSPFPGPYGAFNIDPALWLAEHGVTFGNRGRFEVSGYPVSCAPPPDLSATQDLLARAAASGGYRSAVFFQEAAVAGDPNATYEPVVADPDLLGPGPLWPSVLATLPLFALGVGGIILATR